MLLFGHSWFAALHSQRGMPGMGSSATAEPPSPKPPRMKQASAADMQNVEAASEALRIVLSLRNDSLASINRLHDRPM